MFLFRVKVEELTERSLALLQFHLHQSEATLRKACPIREMNVVADERASRSDLDIYLAVDDFIDSKRLTRLFGDLLAMIDVNLQSERTGAPRISTELIHF